MAHLLHVLFPHHGHTAFAHGIKDDFNLSKPREHPQEAHNLAFLKIVEQAAGGDQNRSIRHIGADLPDPVLGKGVSGEIGLPLRLRQQLSPVLHHMGQIHGIPARPSVVAAGICRLQTAAELNDHAVRPVLQKGPDVPVHIGGPGGGGQQGILALSVLLRQAGRQFLFQFQRLWIVQDLRAVLAGIDPAQHGDKQRVLYNTQLGHGQPSCLDKLLSAHK